MSTYGSGIRIEGATKPTSIDVDSYENAIYAKRIVEIPSNLQMRIEYGANGKSKYAGYAPRGVGEDTEGWLIQYFEYDGSNRIVKRTIGYDSWDNRDGASYE